MRFSTFILVSFCWLFSCTVEEDKPSFDWQGHRGCRGLMPENSIVGFLHALEFQEITTLELDVVISNDSQVVVSHEPWMSDEICSLPEALDSNEVLNIFELDYEEIQGIDCGSKVHSRFPDQKKMTVRKPLLLTMLDSVGIYCKAKNRPLPMLNIEIKSRPEWDNTFTPTPKTFAQLLLNVIKNSPFEKLTTIQSFDTRSLEAVHEMNESFSLAYLVWQDSNFIEALDRLSFVPDIYSPYFPLVNKDLIGHAKTLNMKVIPWTVNEQKDMIELIDLGVDGIITDYPNRIPQGN